jgi:hypothetical protein
MQFFANLGMKIEEIGPRDHKHVNILVKRHHRNQRIKHRLTRNAFKPLDALWINKLAGISVRKNHRALRVRVVYLS